MILTIVLFLALAVVVAVCCVVVGVTLLFERRVLQEVDIGFVGDITGVNTRVSSSGGAALSPRVCAPKVNPFTRANVILF